MPSAEASLNFQTQVGNLPATTRRTLQEILELYISGNTDHATWVHTIESNQIILHSFLSATDLPPSRWSEDFSTRAIRAHSLIFANQLIRNDSPPEGRENAAAVMMARELADRLGQAIFNSEIQRADFRHKAELSARLMGMECTLNDHEMNLAIRSSTRPLAELYDTPALIRIVAIAQHAENSDLPEPALYSDLLAAESMDTGQMLDICAQLSSIPSPEEAPSPESISRLISLANLLNLATQLATQTSAAKALKEISGIFFSTMALDVYLQNGDAWTNGIDRLTSDKSQIVNAASTGKIVSSTSHDLSLVDEQLVERLGTDEAISIPVLLDDDPDSCAAVIAIGMSKSQILESIGHHELLGDFQLLCRQILLESSTQEGTISLDRVDQLAREIIHEASNPLSTIANYLKVLSLQLGQEHEAQETIDTISAEIQRTASIIKSFRDIGSDVPDQDTNCYPSAVIKKISNLFGKSSEGLQLELQAAGEDQRISIGSEALSQITTNLIKNAQEAMEGNGSLTIRTSSNIRMQDSIMTEISFVDSGPGIPEELGDVFSRGVTTKSGEHQGEGLAVVKALTEKSGGFISYRSTPAGTEIRINIPQVNTGNDL